MSKEKIIRQVSEIEQASHDMHKAMAKTPEREQEKQLKIAEFKKKFPDALYLEPIQRIPTGGVRHPEFDKQLDYLKEYVVGVFESNMIYGQLEFDLAVIPGEDYCRWRIPVNKPVGIPRFVAQHLEKGLGWKEMIPLSSSQSELPLAGDPDNAHIPFQKFVHKKRGTFHPISAY